MNSVVALVLSVAVESLGKLDGGVYQFVAKAFDTIYNLISDESEKLE